MDTHTHTHTHYIYIYFRCKKRFLRTTRGSSTWCTGTKYKYSQFSCFTSTKSTNTDIFGAIFLLYWYKSTNTDTIDMTRASRRLFS